MISQNNLSLKDVLAKMLANQPSNRDLNLLDTVKNREFYKSNYPDGPELTPQPYYSPEQFKKTHPLYPEHDQVFNIDQIMNQLDRLKGDSDAGSK